MNRIFRRHRLWILGLTLAASLCGAFFLWVVWSEGPPLRWTLRGRHFERVEVRWGKQKLNSRDPQIISRFDNAIRPATAAMAYSTRCLPEDRENWSVTLFDQRNQPFEVNLGLDSCGTFYVPSVGSTYTSDPDLLSLCNISLGRPAGASPFSNP